MSRGTFGGRVAAAFVGAIIGGFIGFALAWIFGIYSNTLGPSGLHVNFKSWVAICAAGFGAVGLLFGSFVGSLLGSAISWIFWLEGANTSSNHEIPGWLALALLLGVATGAWWLFS